jgi:hypothetical protein
METPRDLGIEFKAEDGVVTIRAVDGGGEGEAVGLMVGDVIDGVDGLPGGTVEEKIVELCDDSRELRATVIRVRRGGVVMAVELFADAVPELADDQDLLAEWKHFAAAAAPPVAAIAQPAVDVETAAAAAADDAPIEPPSRLPIEEEGRFGPRPHPPGMPVDDQRFFENSGRSISYQASDENYNPFGWLPDRGAL